MPSESATRKEIIDLRLKEAGWRVSDPTQVIEEYFLPPPNNDDNATELALDKRLDQSGSREFSDYVLLGKNGKPVAVVEAKQSSKSAELGREQAKQYCQNIQANHDGELPFCFYTNGHEIFFWNLGEAPPQKVHGFPTRQDLERLLFIRKHKKALSTELINTAIAGRDFQLQAIRSVMEGIERNRRLFLLVMATGTGKTRTCIALIDALMRAGRVQRILFLVDRIALRGQALDAFKEHIPDEPRWPNLGEKAIATDRRIYVATYPTMLNIVRDETGTLSPHFFDLIVIDESHRSIYNTYGEVLDYFNAIKLGLTATPRDVVDHNTFTLFECEDGLPTFAYSYDEAIAHVPPYLCDFRVLKIKTRFQDEGISKRTISLEDQKQLILEGKEIEDINFEGSDLEKTVTNHATNALIVREFMEESIKDPNGVLPGKTIFFCMSMKHARRIETIFDSLYPEYKGELAKVMVSDDPRVYGRGGLLDQFTRNDMPRVAISVDMLDTGIDVREIVNLVFAKPVYSYTKFWQMIGRGTRLLESEKIKSWCPEKNVFQVIDCWDNFEYFKITPKGKELKSQIPLPVRFVGVRIDKIEAAQTLGYASIAEKEISSLRTQIAALPTRSVAIMEAQARLARCQKEDFWQPLTAEHLAFLRHAIQPLFRVISQEDFKAMRFTKEVLEASLAHMKGEKEKYAALTESLMAQVSELPLSVNIVAQQGGIIQKAQTNHYWATMTDQSFDHLAEQLSPLMHFRDGRGVGDGPAKFNFADVLAAKEFVEFGPEHESLSIAQYRQLVEQRVKELTASNPILQKIRDGEPVDEMDAETLAAQLQDEHPHITLQLLRRVYQHQSAPFLKFIRHILGIEILESFPDTVSRSIDQFIAEHPTLTSHQLQFLNLLRDYLIHRGGVEKRDLIQAPFTIIHPSGIRGVFSPAEINEILALTERLAA
ncbi:type I restriction endonuclease subunit R [Granulicella mallensis]|uniref:Type I site-specific deoxyribonuclease n=1 Tax=Granulicella mallensis (strain ATCC BAA-1857 / DSM 23137 / MP5ACTX8) TaxID=682795 RepID=G8NT47_GRAMM|nr:DEAD/DEAH box helicase family protein [Granulicella mallensis]AEU37477.1 Type I site-specific deoxyribonuclease [Granulicella mallensis MP5ACTX8]